MESIHDDKVLEVGFNVPANIGMAVEEISTPALIIDLNAFSFLSTVDLGP